MIGYQHNCSHSDLQPKAFAAEPGHKLRDDSKRRRNIDASPKQPLNVLSLPQTIFYRFQSQNLKILRQTPLAVLSISQNL